MGATGTDIQPHPLPHPLNKDDLEGKSCILMENWTGWEEGIFLTILEGRREKKNNAVDRNSSIRAQQRGTTIQWKRFLYHPDRKYVDP